MATDNLEVKVHIGAELREIKNALSDLRSALKKSGSSGAAAGRETERGFKAATRQIKLLRQNAKSVGRQIKTLAISVAAAFGARSVIQASDAYKLMEGRIKLVTKGEKERTAVEKALFKVAQRTRSDMVATVELYGRMARAGSELGVSQKDLLGVTETINKAIQVSGATAQEAANGVVQFAQGLAAGALQGQDLKSVSEQMPRLLEAIIKGVNEVNPGLNLTRKNFRKVAAEGKLTTELIIDALKTQAGVVNKEFSQLPRTVGQAMTQLRNQFQRSLAKGNLQPLVDSIDRLRTAVSDPKFIEALTLTITSIMNFLKFIVDNAGIINKASLAILGIFVGAVFGGIKGALFGGLTGGAIALLKTLFEVLTKSGDSAAKKAKAVSEAMSGLGEVHISPGAGVSLDDLKKKAKELTDKLAAAKKILSDYQQELSNGVAIGAKTAAQAQTELAAKSKELAATIGEGAAAKLRAFADQIQRLGDPGAAQGLRTAASEIERMTAAGRTSALAGLKQGLQDYVSGIGSLAKQIRDVVSGAFKGMEDALVGFVKTGKLQVRSLVDAILSDFARIAIRQSITKPLTQALLSAPFFGSANGNAFNRGQVLAFANGGAFTNGIVNSSTTFPLGVMGEAGPEAIMPLKRTKSGNLGVVASGSGAQVEVNVIESPGQGGQVNQRNNGERKIVDVLVERVKTDLLRDVQSDGQFAQGLEGRYGLNRTPGATR